MTEFIARYMDDLGIPPLILSRGYAGGDEAKMLQRHLSQTSAKIGVGANRTAAAAEMFERYGCMDLGSSLYFEALLSPFKLRPHLRTEMIGIVILDDGMQHWSLFRNAELVMINGLSPWGNNHLIPRGSLREPPDALGRAHIGVIHHADLVSSTGLKNIVSTMQKINPSLSIFFSRLSPMFLFDVKDPLSKLPLTMVINKVILCVSAIGFPDAFIRRVMEIGPLHVDRLDFSDHHSIKPNDVNKIIKILTLLHSRFGTNATVLVTEKDYDRDPEILREIDDFQIMVLCSSLQIMPFEDRTEEDFRMVLNKLVLSI
ncbi:probable tetraacyldisaccharide 4'-kinase, mitochondrial [Phalaenopsis equestris]|uniref:probable tetraacyldisaccharide 4'-kinase, mitochondrial n=1 Tax=Phalaenopsis equestris TaxID=78828 RepID=UPI0009E26C73|nr:probable tetraacyldisaccharide 4'-kinase, mitochondrial [Phalaenopsis equestris]